MKDKWERKCPYCEWGETEIREALSGYKVICNNCRGGTLVSFSESGVPSYNSFIPGVWGVPSKEREFYGEEKKGE